MRKSELQPRLLVFTALGIACRILAFLWVQLTGDPSLARSLPDSLNTHAS